MPSSSWIQCLLAPYCSLWAALRTPSSLAKKPYDIAKEPKELFVVEGATHVDLYDKPQYVDQAVAKLAEFFGKYL